MRFNFAKRINITVLLLSLCLAIVCWYVVAVNNRIDVQLSVRLDYKNMPDNLVVIDGLVNTITVRLRGPETLLRPLTSQALTYAIDLSFLHKGENIHNLMPTVWSGAMRAFEVLEVNPPQLSIVADSVRERNLRVQAIVSSFLHDSALKVANINVSPSNIVVRGPESVVRAMQDVSAIVQIDPNSPAGNYNKNIFLQVPVHVSASPSSVNVSYTMEGERTVINLERDIIIDAQVQEHYTIDQENLLLTVEVPAALQDNYVYLQDLSVSVTPPLLEIGQSMSVPLYVILPEGMTLVRSVPRTVTIKRHQ